MSKNINITYPKSLSHFELCYLTINKAIEIIRSSRSIISENSRLKPKVIVVALDELCDNEKKALEYKKALMKKMFSHEQEVEDDNYHYNVDEGA